VPPPLPPPQWLFSALSQPCPLVVAAMASILRALRASGAARPAAAPSLLPVWRVAVGGQVHQQQHSGRQQQQQQRRAASSFSEAPKACPICSAEIEIDYKAGLPAEYHKENIISATMLPFLGYSHGCQVSKFQPIAAHSPYAAGTAGIRDRPPPHTERANVIPVCQRDGDNLFAKHHW